MLILLKFDKNNVKNIRKKCEKSVKKVKKVTVKPRAIFEKLKSKGYPFKVPKMVKNERGFTVKKSRFVEK